MDKTKATEFGRELAALINKYGLDAAFNTPDFILAQHMMWSADALNHTCFLRDSWFGRIDAAKNRRRSLKWLKERRQRLRMAS